MHRIASASMFAALCVLPATPAAGADKYPQRPIRLIAPFPPGGGVDINARLLADPLGQALGQTVVVDNRGGAGGRLGLELISKAIPDGYTLGIGGIGMAIHLAMELLLTSQKATMLHVPYKGTGPALTALLSNEITVYLSTFASALPHVKAERLRSFAVSSAKRAKPLPDVPTIAESGVPGYEYSTWYGLVAPAGVPRTIVDQINQATVAALNTPEIRQRYESQGLEPTPSTSAHYIAYLKSETEKWAKVVRSAKIELQ